MSNEQQDHLGLLRFRVLMYVALVACCASAVYFARSHYRRKAAAAKNERSLVHDLVAATAAASQRSTPIRVALFADERGDGDATEDLAGILDSEFAHRWEFVSPDDIRAGVLDRFDVVIFPGGSGHKHAIALGEAAALSEN